METINSTTDKIQQDTQIQAVVQPNILGAQNFPIFNPEQQNALSFYNPQTKADQIALERTQWFNQSASLENLMKDRKEKLVTMQRERRQQHLYDKRKINDFIFEDAQNNVNSKNSMELSKSKSSGVSSVMDLDNFNEQNPFQTQEQTYQVEDTEFQEDMTYEFKQNKPQQYQKRKDKDKGNNRLYYAQQLQTHDFLLRQDLAIVHDSNFLIYPRPVGQRCLVTSAKGNTIARNNQGFIKIQFQSPLPNGSRKQNNQELNQFSTQNGRHCAVLDCIMIDSQKLFYVIDIMFWEDMDYSEFPLCSRLLFMQQKFQEIKDLNSDLYEYKFKLMEFQPCNSKNLLGAIYGDVLAEYVNYQEVIKLNGDYEIYVDEEKLLQDLKKSDSQISIYYKQLIQKLSDQKVKLNEAKLQSDLPYAIKLMQLYIFDSQMILAIEKDGIIFNHIESAYEKGLNTLVLHWRDPSISNYCSNDEDEYGLIQTVLRLTDDYNFETYDGEVLEVSINCKNTECIMNLDPQNIYNLKIKIQTVLSDPQPDIGDSKPQEINIPTSKIEIVEIHLSQRTSKIIPDHLSKIISKSLHLQGENITASKIIRAIESNEEPLQSLSTKSLSMNDGMMSDYNYGQSALGQTFSNNSNKMSDI
eukprot:403364218